ncbi:MAG: S-layer homology domain-containing protein [Chloroflexia bacterium]
MLTHPNTHKIVAVSSVLIFLLAGFGLYTKLTQAGHTAIQPASVQAYADGPTLTPTPTPAPCDPLPTRVNSPNGSGVINRLRSVDAISPTDIWAVGDYQSSGFFQTMTIHWDGSQWTLISSPNGPGEDNHLYGVKAIASNDVWAVGESLENPGTTSTALVLRWNGSSWNIVNAPSPNQYNALYGVSAVSSSDVWAVGIQHDGTANSERTLALHWNGSQWLAVNPPNYGTGANFVTDVEALAANDVWAVGYAYEPAFTGFRTITWHWNGSSWSVVSSPNLVTQGDNKLLAVSASSATDVWAVGYSYDGAEKGTVLRYNGSSWQLVDFPLHPPTYGNALRGVYAISPADVWVIGNYGDDHLTARWDGNAWRRIFDPVYDELLDITAASPSVVWSVGYDARFTLTIRYTYPCPPGTPSATATGMASATRTRTYTATPITSSSSTATPTRTQTITPAATTSATAIATQTNTAVASSTAVTTATSTALASPTHCAIVFQDVPEGSTFYSFIRCMACQGIVTGYPCGGPGEPCGGMGDPYFRPGSNVTRGQIAKIVSNSAGFFEPVTGQTFEDVPPGSTFHEFIQRLTNRQIMSGYPCGNPEPCVPPGNRPYFRPGANATRGQLAKIVSNAANIQDPVSGQTFEDVVPGSTFYEFIERLVAREVMSGYPCGNPEPCVPPGNRPYFRPSSNVTRGQTAKLVASTFFPGCAPPRQ